MACGLSDGQQSTALGSAYQAFAGIRQICRLPGLLVAVVDGEPVTFRVNVPGALLKIEKVTTTHAHACQPQPIPACGQAEHQAVFHKS